MQRIIDAVSARIDRPIRGWKTYSVYKPMNPPVQAPIYDLFPSGATIPADISPARLIEPEIMFRVDTDLPPRERHLRHHRGHGSGDGGGRFRGDRLALPRRRRFGQCCRACRSGIAVRLVVGPPRERLHRRWRFHRRLARRRVRGRRPATDRRRPRAHLCRRLPPLRQPVSASRRGREPFATPSRRARQATSSSRTRRRASFRSRLEP